MNRCDHFQNQLLDHLYDLLEPGDGQALSDHLKDCAACQGALARARQQKDLLAAAARQEFPTVTFTAPPTGVSARQDEEPAILAGPMRRSWMRWAVAAAILLVLGGFGVPGSLYWRQSHQLTLAEAQYKEKNLAEREIEKQLVERRTKADEDLKATIDEIDRLGQEKQKKTEQVRLAINNQQLHLTITGPETLEAGAPNKYRIETRALNHQPSPAQLSARVLDQDKKVVFEEKGIRTAGDYLLTLPPDLHLKPNSELYLEVAAKGEQGTQGELREKLTLAGPLYVTHLATDKPMYQPGEVVHFRSLTLERFSLKAVQEDLNLIYTITRPAGDQVQILGGMSSVVDERNPNKTPLLGPDKKPLRGVGAGEYPIPPESMGGEYTLTVSEAKNRFLAQQRKFIVNRYQKPQLNKELEFTRKSYGLGDQVVAACKVSPVAGGQPVANKPVTATINVDGTIYGANGQPGGPLNLQTDATGGVSVKFTLPGKIQRGDASLAVAFTDGANRETIVRPIPVALKKLNVDFFPEGGYLVAGVPNRVYFQARTMLDKPSEVKGRIVDGQGKAVALIGLDGKSAERVQTLNDDKEPGANQGMGLFGFTPEAGKKYELKIDVPSGIEGRYPLPDVEEDRVALSIHQGVASDNASIKLVIHSGKRDRALVVGAYCRGRLMAHKPIDAKAGRAADIELQPESGLGGVCRVTVFEKRPGAGQRLELLPVAERLIYRVPAERLNLAVKPDKPQYVPGDKVDLNFLATNEKGQAVPAILMVATVDKSVLKLADEKTFRSMPTHFLLTTEVLRPEDLEHADFLLGHHAKAGSALDLLLGTQGWRRFAEQKPEEFQKKQGQEADRLLVLIGHFKQKLVNFDQEALAKVTEEFEPKFGALHERLTQAEANLKAVNQEGNQQMTQADRDRLEAGKTMALETKKVNELKESIRKFASVGLPVLAVLLFIGGVVTLVQGLRHTTSPKALPYFATAACSILLFGLVVTVQVGSMLEPQKKASDFARAQSIAPPPPNGPGGGPPMGGAGGMPVAQKDGAPPPPMAPPRDMAVPEGAPAPVAEERLGAGGARGGKGANLKEDAKKAPEMRKMDMPGKPGADPGTPPPAKAAKPAPANLPAEAKGQGLQEGKERLDFRFADNGKAKDQAKQMEKAAKELPRQADAENRARDGKDKAAFGRGEAKAAIKREAEQFGLQKDLKELAPAAAARAPAQFQPEPQGKNAVQALKRAEDARRSVMAGGREAAPDQLRQLRDGDMDRAPKADEASMPAPLPLVVREYAHQRTPTSSGDERRQDFTETLYWHPVLVLPDDGKAKVSFNLCDSVTTFQVLAAGHTLDGRIGSVTSELMSRKPFTLEPKLPTEVTASDRIDVPLAIANNTSASRSVTVQVNPGTALELMEGKVSDKLTLAADERVRRVFRFRPNIVEGKAELQFDGQSEPFANDSVGHTFTVVPEGFPVVASKSDVLEGIARHEIALPQAKDLVPGTLKVQVAAYPSTLADLQKGLEAMLREPGGCFEQTSTSNYPNLLILDYLKETDQAKPELARDAQAKLARGYQILTNFECMNTSKNNQREGYEWFGGTAPAHEALTAYGLMEFRDMARVYDVDQKMVERTRNYLMDRKDGKGGFTRNPRALDTFGRAPDNITNAYIVWALTESGKDDDVTKELDALAKQARDSKDPYFLSLVANSLLNRGRTDEGLALLKKIAAAQQKDGHLDAAQTSITGSGGRDLQIETTALAVFAWLKANRPVEFNTPVQAGVKWLGQQRGGYGGFGSTQSTILTLKALIAYARANKKTAEAGDLVLKVGEKTVKQHFAAGADGAIVLDLPEAEKALRLGEKNNLTVELTGKNVFPYTLTWSYQALKPISAEQCAVRLTTKLDRDKADEGETVRLTAVVENKSGKGQGMTVAVLGLPSGLMVPVDLKQLKDHARLRNNGTEPGLISAYEIRGRELVLYWRDLAPDKKIEVNLDLICQVPGVYRGPASRAYLYYNADHKCWVEPLSMTIKPKSD